MYGVIPLAPAEMSRGDFADFIRFVLEKTSIYSIEYKRTKSCQPEVICLHSTKLRRETS